MLTARAYGTACSYSPALARAETRTKRSPPSTKAAARCPSLRSWNRSASHRFVVRLCSHTLGHCLGPDEHDLVHASQGNRRVCHKLSNARGRQVDERGVVTDFGNDGVVEDLGAQSVYRCCERSNHKGTGKPFPLSLTGIYFPADLRAIVLR